MKYKKIIIFIAVILSAACFLFSCTDTGKNIDESGEESTPETSGEETADSNSGDADSEPAAESAEIPQPPELPDGFVSSSVRNIAPGVVFDKSFRRGINMGNMLEAHEEGAWGVYFDPEFFVLIKERGFDFIRLPVAWHYYTTIKSDGSPSGISQWFLDRVKYIVDEALKNDLGIIINIHHFNDMDNNPEENAEKLYMIWRVISEQYQNYPANVAFEVFNEPHEKLDTKTWNQYQNECIKIIRETNPRRKIVVSAGDWGGVNGILDLTLPEDENLILSFHCYDPFNFTHQGADWTSDDMNRHLGTQWLGTDFEKRNIENTFRYVKAWSEAAGLPVLLGEFGAFSRADMESRARWTQYMRETAEYYGFAWSYWEFCSGFGIYDQNSEEFFEDLADALTGTPIDESAYATGTGMPKITADRGLGFIGPFTVERNINMICDSWTGYTFYDTEEGTQIIELGGAATSDWAHAFIVLDELKYTDAGFSHETVELTIRNIDGSITDFCINIDSGGSTEAQLSWMNESVLKQETSAGITQNDNGTTTFILNLQSVYRTFRSDNDGVFRIKMFIESVPDRRGNYDREGKIEFIKVELK